MIKAIIFDLDGVLVDADKWHFNALNVALQHSEVDPISWQEHLTIYKGIPTRKKLEILTERKGLPRELWDKINGSKQDVTTDIISKFCTPDLEKIEMMKLLKRKYPVVICSNAIRPTVELMLQKSGLLPYVDFYLSNQDVKTPKPDPEIYLKAFERLGMQADECVIVEDSDVGKRAAAASGGVLCSVGGPSEVNYYRILRTIIESERINVVIPAAGQGKRFSEAGYQHPKPLIDVDGKPMIELVLDNFYHVGRAIFVLQKKHIDQYCADAVVKHLAPGSEVVHVDGLTEGAVCTVLRARDLINNSNELVIANSDQFVDMDVMDFVRRMRRRNADAGILTFADDDPKWSYARCDESGRVVEVAEKVVISNQATVGIYYYRRGSDFVRYAEQMIRKNIRVNNEFYVCPVFNEFIGDGKSIYTFEIGRDRMHGLGTPEDLERFTSHVIESVAA
jgi:beta-phosphoglucomutase-like phosphatase (HAD superfamily)/dTDP-glucose pyrophosphorylase